jgi:very-short-patch-repair endonuclease
MAAVLACGHGAVVSHRSAAALYKVLPYPARGDVWITTPSAAGGQRPGIRLRRTRRLHRLDVSELDGLPITSLSRTILDLAAIVEKAQLEQAVAQVLVGTKAGMTGARRRVTVADLREGLARNPGRRGALRLRTLLERTAGPALTESEAERLFLRIVRCDGLPEPQTQGRIGPYRVDFLWPDQRVVAEIDGFTFHSHGAAFQRDRARTNDLQLRGYTVLRFTWADLTRRANHVAARVRDALARAEQRAAAPDRSP